MIVKHILYQKSRTEKILNSQKNILIVTNGENIIEANKSFLDFFEFQKLEDFKKEYKCICDHFKQEDGFLQSKMGKLNWVEYILENPNKINLAKIQKNSAEHIFKVLAQKINDKNKFEVVVTFEDITRELEIEKELIKQKNIISESNDTKNQFLANISHELRTPMNAIIGFTKLFFDTKLDSTQYNLLAKIDVSSKLLLSIIEDILYITQIESKEFVLDNKPLHLDSLIDYIETSFFEEALKQNNKFVLNIDENLPKNVLIDKIKLLQVLSNLLSNAFKFTKDGEVSLNISLIETIEPSKAKVKFSVIDNGIGIKDGFKKLIFNNFYQIDNSDTRQFKGSGLGLSICQKIVELFGSKIELKSEYHKGSEFSFTIIIDVLENEINIENSYPIFENIKILLVEDNIINQEVATMILKKSNVKVDIASNGLQAIEIFKKNKNKYNLILMDIQMPILDGFEATKEIRKIDAKIPIIALTASNLIEDRQKALESLMNDFLLKPIDTAELYSKIIKHIKLDKTKIKYVENQVKVENNILNKNSLESLTNDKNFINKLLKKFLEQLDKDFKDIVKEVQENSPKAKSLIHSLKGMSGNISATSLYEICRKIDEKYKKSIHISSVDIKTLECAIEDIKGELSFLNNIPQESQRSKKTILSISKEDLKKLLSEIIKDLKDGNFIEDKKVQKLYKNLQVITSKDIDTLKKYIEDFDYNLATEFLEDILKEDII